MNFFKGFWQLFVGDEDQQRFVEKQTKSRTQTEVNKRAHECDDFEYQELNDFESLDNSDEFFNE